MTCCVIYGIATIVTKAWSDAIVTATSDVMTANEHQIDDSKKNFELGVIGI